MSNIFYKAMKKEQTFIKGGHKVFKDDEVKMIKDHSNLYGIARKLGCSSSYVYRVLHGGVKIRMELAKKIHHELHKILDESKT